MAKELRSTWRGAISFGMVNIPVKAYTSTDEKSVKFSLQHRDCGGAVKMPKSCGTCETTLDSSSMQKVYEIRKGEFVVMDETDFERVPTPTAKTIIIERFIDPSEIDSTSINQTYYIGPDEASKPYALLRAALEQTGLIALAKWTYAGKERLAVLRLHQQVLSLQTLYWADEVKDASKLAVVAPALSEQEVAMALTLVNAMKADAADLTEYRDEYREALLEIIDQKDAGVAPLALPVAAKVETVDLMAALQASIDAAKKVA